MPLRLVTSSDPNLLLRAAADGFLNPSPATTGDPFPTVPYLLALRQGALRDDLLDLAAQSGVRGWFDPPLCIFHELPSRLGVAERTILGDYERAVLLGTHPSRHRQPKSSRSFHAPTPSSTRSTGCSANCSRTASRPHAFATRRSNSAPTATTSSASAIADLRRAYAAYLERTCEAWESGRTRRMAVLRRRDRGRPRQSFRGARRATRDPHLRTRRSPPRVANAARRARRVAGRSTMSSSTRRHPRSTSASRPSRSVRRRTGLRGRSPRASSTKARR